MCHDDATLVREAAEGSHQAFAALVRRYAPSAMAIAVSRLGGRADAEDAVQEALIQAWRDVHRLEDPRRFGAWLRGIVTHRCADSLRRVRPAPLGDQDRGRDSLVEPAEDAAPVRSAVQSLPDTYREPVALFYLAQMTIAETATELGLPEGTVKRRLHEARRMLRGRMIEMMAKDMREAGDVAERVVHDLEQRGERFEEMLSAVQADDWDSWATWWHERRMEDVRANASQYGTEPDETLARMRPEYRRSDTFRDDGVDMPRRWGFPEHVDVAGIGAVAQRTGIHPVEIIRSELRGLPVLRYHPWVLYDRERATEWLEANGAQPGDADSDRPLLTALRATYHGEASGEELVTIMRALTAERRLTEVPDPGEWASAHVAELHANAARYGLDGPADTFWGIPPTDQEHVWDARDACRRLGTCPIHLIRWTRQGLECVRRSPYIRWDVRRAGSWLAERGILPPRRTPKELDVLEEYVARAVARRDATPLEAAELLEGSLGIR